MTPKRRAINLSWFFDKKSVHRNDLVNLAIINVGELITDKTIFSSKHYCLYK